MILTVTACWGNFTSEFPPGLEPLGENLASLPQGSDADPYPQELNIVTGYQARSDTTPEFDYAHGKGYIHGTASKVWLALQNSDVMATHRYTDYHEVTEDIEPDYEYSLEYYYRVDDILTVEWRENWRFGTIVGAPESPEHGMVRYQKVWGSTFIDLIQGSFQIFEIAPDIVELQIIGNADSVGSGQAEIRQGMLDRFDSIIAFVNGAPLPDL